MLTRLEFRKRFTNNEKVAIELASLDNPSSSIEERQMQAMLRVYLADTSAASYVDVTDPSTIYGVQALAQFGIIDKSRVFDILAPVNSIESSGSIFMLPEGYPVLSNPEIVVASSGEYQPDQLVNCYLSSDLSKTTIVAYSARYIVTGETNA
jgi:hypothetical protein